VDENEQEFQRDIKKCHDIMARWLAAGAKLKLMVECGGSTCHNWQRVNGRKDLRFLRNCYLCETPILNLTARSSLQHPKKEGG